MYNHYDLLCPDRYSKYWNIDKIKFCVEPGKSIIFVSNRYVKCFLIPHLPETNRIPSRLYLILPFIPRSNNFLEIFSFIYQLRLIVCHHFSREFLNIFPGCFVYLLINKYSHHFLFFLLLVPR